MSSDNRNVSARLPRCTVDHGTKDRLTIFGLTLAALTFVICSVVWAHTTMEASLNLCPWAHMTLEASLNSLWVLLAAGALVHWIKPDGGSRRGHLPGLVSLVFVLALLLPVISANDDLTKLELINDAKTSQSITTTIQNDKQLPVFAAMLSSPLVSAVQVVPYLHLRLEPFSEHYRGPRVATPGETTGNHSPPLC